MIPVGFLAATALFGGVLLACASGLTRMLGNRVSAAVRYLILGTGFLAVFLVPFVTLLLRSAPAPIRSIRSGIVLYVTPEGAEARAGMHGELPVAAALTFGWIAGLLVFLPRLVRSARKGAL